MDRISAFMDGESGQTETRQSMQRLKQDDECCETWATYHLIGDMMRGAPVLRDDFMARFQAQMKDEPTQLAPRLTLRKSANLALSMAASVCAIAVVLLLVFTDNPLSPQGQVASALKIEETAVASADVAGRSACARSAPTLERAILREAGRATVAMAEPGAPVW